MKLISAFLVPNPGMIIRDPGTKKIVLAGGEIKIMVGKDGRYWKRRLKDGDMTIKNMTPVRSRKTVVNKGEKS